MFHLYQKQKLHLYYHKNVTVMKKKNILSLILLLTIFCGFNSCVDKPLDYVDNPDYLLCNNRGWYHQYRDDNGYVCEQIFSFYTSGQGEETLIRHYDWGPSDEFHYTFQWYWDEEYVNSIFMDYSDGSYSYFADMYISTYKLSGVLNDVDVTFEPY